MVERIETGIPGLDELIEGGFPVGSVTLVSGGAGAGKTIFSSQFLWHGLQEDENCLFITLEEDPDEIMEDAAEFGWDFAEYAGERFKMVYLNPFQGDAGFTSRIRRHIDEVEADRVVIDSTSVMGMRQQDPGRIRENLYDLVRNLRKANVTSVITSEIPRGTDNISRYGVEEFVADGVIVLRGLGVAGEMGRRLRIEKMRKTDIAEDVFSLDFTDDGLTVREMEKGLSL